MIVFPPAKINLGLSISAKRTDGYHELETVMIPIPFVDILEIIPAKSFEFHSSGIAIPSATNDNLCVKAFELIRQKHNIPNVYMHLRKQIPMGAGLGGGSSDAAYVLKTLNELFELRLSLETLEEYAAQLGSDCPFFIQTIPQLAKGRGEVLTPIPLTLHSYYLVLLNPGIHVGTKEAYAGVIPQVKENSILDFVLQEVSSWQENLVNDFEKSVFAQFPEIAKLKENLLQNGAIYAAMSGSGSSVFGIFKDKPEIPSSLLDFVVFQGFFEA